MKKQDNIGMDLNIDFSYGRGSSMVASNGWLADLEVPGHIPDISALVLEIESPGSSDLFVNFFSDLPDF